MFGLRRFRCTSLALVLACGLGGVAVTVPEAQAADEARAEYFRLSQELARLADRNAWSGVERTWQQILATGVSPSQADLLIAAHSAKNVGDVTEMRGRLVRASELGENRQVLDWLWEVDSNYGRAELYCDPPCALEPDVMPFAPDQVAAVTFAQGRIASGAFDGYLPAGAYRFGTYDVRIVPRVSSVRIDARGAVRAPREEPTRPAREEARPPRDEPPPRPERAPRPEPEARPEPPPPEVRPARPEPIPPPPPPREAVSPRPARPGPVPPAPTVRTEPNGPVNHPLALLVGVGNRFGGIVGGGVGALLRAPVGEIGLGLSGGVGYDVEFATIGYHGGARLYLPAIPAGTQSTATIYLGGGYSPLIWWQTVDDQRKVAHGPHGTLGLDLRAGHFVLDASGELGVAFAAQKWRPAPGFAVGIGVAFP
jgi:hypothetical protein